MVKTLYLIRHGETIDANERRYKGHLDVPLSENGVEQMESVTAFIKDKIQDRKNHESCMHLVSSKLSAVYCSDLSRAIRSAEVIAKPFGLKPIVMPELRERSFGEWEGMSFDEIKERYPEEFNAWADNPLRFSPRGGENTIEVRDRVMNALDEILNMVGEQKNGRAVVKTSEPPYFQTHIAVVSHGGVNRIILCHLLGVPLENIFRIEQDYGCLNVIEFHDDYPVVKLINYRCR